MFDRHLHELAVSTRWSIMHGREREGTLLESWRAVFERALGGELIRADEERWVQVDGSTRWLRWAILPWWTQDGAVGGVAIWTEDITDRKRADEERRETQVGYTTIFEKSPFGIALTRWADQIVVSANAAFLALFEITREEALGSSSADLGLWAPDWQDQLERELETRGAVRDFECVRRSRSGTTRTLSLNLDWIVLGGEKHVLTTIRDVTELKRAHETARLYEQAKHVDVLKTRFFASASHDLRTPLTLILATTERLLQ
jgi:PAS domain S-box-containing protein